MKPSVAPTGALARAAAAQALILALMLLGAAPAAAQPPYPAPYAPETPTAGALYSDGQTGKYLLGGDWLYRADPADAGIAQGFWQNTASSAGWAPTTIPNSDNAGDFSNASQGGYVGWYRKDFLLPTAAKDRFWVVRFESVNYRATVWLNGRKIGSHVGGYLPFELDLSGAHSGVNRLLVRVDGRRSQSDIPPGTYGGSPYGGGWWNFGGILSEVYIRYVVKGDIEQAQIRSILACPAGLPPARRPGSPDRAAPESSSCSAQIDEQAKIRNVTAKPLKVHLRGTYGGARLDFGSQTLAPHATWTAASTVTIKHPRLWAPGSPTLYRATLTLTGPKRSHLSGYVGYSGIRSISVIGGQLQLNGRPLQLRGVGLQEQTVGQGAALAPPQYAQLAGWVQALHGDFIRSQYPLDQKLLEAADRAGIVVWLETPIYQVPSQYLDDPSWLQSAHSMLTESVLADQNHPSVLMWSIGNELATPPSGAETSYIAGAVALMKQLDPTRPVGLAIASWPGIPCEAAYAPLDIIGYNDYFGWYDAGAGAISDRDQLGPYLDFLRACYPNQALMVTEFGFEADADGPVEVRGTYAFQTDSIQYHLSAFGQRPWLSGASYWDLQDFAVRPGWAGGNPFPDPPFLQKGLIDVYGNPKPAFAAVAQAFAATPQVGPLRDPPRRR